MIFELRKRDLVIIGVFTILLVIIEIVIYINFFKKNYSDEQIKNNNYNTFESNYITNDKQADNYLSTYYNLLYWDIDEAYKLLDSSSSFKNIVEFKEYISSLNISSSVVGKFKYYEQAGYDYYDIYDVNGNRWIFKTNGVMNYTVIINK